MGGRLGGYFVLPAAHWIAVLHAGLHWELPARREMLLFFPDSNKAALWEGPFRWRGRMGSVKREEYTSSQEVKCQKGQESSQQGRLQGTAKSRGVNGCSGVRTTHGLL